MHMYSDDSGNTFNEGMIFLAKGVNQSLCVRIAIGVEGFGVEDMKSER